MIKTKENMAQVPFLSDYDPTTQSEGSIDPLGLYLIADRLATKLVPGFRERMSHPRYLTAIAVGAHVCSVFDEDRLANDEISPPYQVYEWQVVQALVKVYKDSDEIAGLPGVNKAMDAYQKKNPLTAANYLKTQSVFGFHGVYRTLAKDIGLIIESRLGEFGDRLLRIWEKEQHLNGFYLGENGRGTSLLKSLRRAVQDGLLSGSAIKGWYWSVNKTIAEHLAPYQIGRKEGKVLLEAFLSKVHPIRKEVISFLIKEDGQRAWSKNKSEKDFHDVLKKIASEELIELLNAIQSYERFARLLQDAFDECLSILSSGNKIYLADLSKLNSVIKASSELPDIYSRVTKNLLCLGLSFEFEESFNVFGEPCKPDHWVVHMIDHHFRVQRLKSHQGKLPWFDIVESGRILPNPNFLNRIKSNSSSEYVHLYRTNSLWSFLTDLKLVK